MHVAVGWKWNHAARPPILSIAFALLFHQPVEILLTRGSLASQLTTKKRGLQPPALLLFLLHVTAAADEDEKQSAPPRAAIDDESFRDEGIWGDQID